MEIYGGFMRRNLLLLTLITAIILYVIMNNQYHDTVYNAKQTLKSNIDYDQKLGTVIGHITAINLENKTFVIKTTRFDGQKVQLKWQIKVKDEAMIKALIDQQTFHVTLQVDLNQYQFTAPKNRYAFDYDAYLFSNNIKGQYYLISIEAAIPCQNFCLDCFRLKCRTWIQNKITHHFEDAQGGFLYALMLGEKSQFEQYEHYKNLGLAHIFAISGLHFGIIYQYLRKLILVKSAVFRAMILLSFMAFLLLLVGGAYSAQRAFYMILYAEGCHILHRKIDVTTNIAVSLLIILTFQPEAILSTGLHLSYYAYICVAILYRKIVGKPFKSKILEAIRFSIGIQILLLPATLYYFQTANLYSFISNALIVPLSTIILPLAMLFLFASLIGVSWVVWPIAKFLAISIDVFYFIGDYLPLDLNYFVYFKKTDFYVLLIYAFFVAFTLIFWTLTLKKRLISKVLVLTLLSGSITWHLVNDRAISVSTFDVGHGDMSLIQNSQTSILIDTGDGKVNSHTLLRSRGIHNLEILILSHAHADHIGDALELMQNISIDQIYMNQATYDRLLILEQDAQISTLVDQSIIILDTTIECAFETELGGNLILSIVPLKGKNGDDDPNDDALIVSLEYGETLGYFLGDISNDVIDAFIETQKETLSRHETIDFVKSAHHGSKTSIHQDLYNNYGIDYVLTSCSTKYKMPNMDFDNLLEVNNIQHFTTYDCGEIDMIVTQDTLKIKRFLKP